jgi:hypothetical protein
MTFYTVGSVQIHFPRTIQIEYVVQTPRIRSRDPTQPEYFLEIQNVTFNHALTT